MFKKPYKSTPRTQKPSFDNSVHSATCSGCGKECQVPFKPNGKKPVFCSTCFIREDKPTTRSAGKTNFYEKKTSYTAPGGLTTEQFRSLNAKLDSIIELLRQAD